MKQKLAVILKFIRKHMVSLGCAAVALIAIILSYWPTQGWFTDLASKVTTSGSASGQVTTLLTHERHLPNVSPDNSTAAAALDFFPTQDVIQKGQDAVKQVGERSMQMLDTVVQINRHVPLVDRALPNGTDIDRAQFGREYLAAMTDDARIRNWPSKELQTPKPGEEPIPPLLAGHKVSEDDIKTYEDRRKGDINSQYLVLDPTGQPTPDSKMLADNAYAAEAPTIPLKLELDASKKYKVYLEPLAIKTPTVLADFQKAVASLPTGELWTAQLNLWISEDVATAVARANVAAADVTQSPVKQITNIEVKDPPYLIVGDPTAGKSDAVLTPAPDVTPTGRASNGMYDVLWFKVGLDVDAAHVADVLDAMQHGQLISVLSVQAQAVDTADAALKGWIYGKAPVTHLDLNCEELILHDWADKYQPADGGAARFAAAQPAGTPSAPSTFMPITVHTTTGQ